MAVIPAMRVDGKLLEKPAIILCWVMPVLVLGPITYYIDRLQATYFVFALIGFGCISLITGRFKSTQFSRVASLFVAYYFMNGLIAVGIASSSYVEVFNRWVPVFEFYMCFQIARQTKLTETQLSAITRWLLICVVVRAGIEVGLFISGQSDLLAFPVYSGVEGEKYRPVINLGGFSFQRLIDPSAMMFLSVAAGMLLFSTEKRGCEVDGKLITDHRPGLWLEKSLETIVAVLALLVNLMSLARAAWIASLVALGYGIFLNRASLVWPRLFRVGLAITVSIVLFVKFATIAGIDEVPSFLYDRAIEYSSEQFNADEGSVQSLRLLEYNTVANAILEHPIFGVGVGSSLGTSVSYSDEHSETWLIHNYFLSMLAETGMVGAALFALLAVMSIRWVPRAIRNAPFENRKLLMVAVLSIAWYSVFISFHPIYSAFHIPALLGMLFGLATTSYENKKSKYESRAN